MPVFTAAAVATFLGIEAGFIATAVAFTLNTAIALAGSIGLSYAAKAVSGNQAQQQKTDNFGVQGTLTSGGAVPRSFPLGFSATAGQLVYANTWGGDQDTPNANLVQVIKVSDMPRARLVGMRINGQAITIPSGGLVGAPGGTDAGYEPPEFVKPRDPNHPDANIVPHVWIKYYDGTQTIADPYLVNSVSSEDRPYEATRVGVGCAYVIVTTLVNASVFSGFPSFLFELSSIPLYDVSRDSTAGGVGGQRYADPSTWGGDGDDMPAVQAYNILRGITYQGAWLYGLQNAPAGRLPVANWITQIEKCRASIAGETGPEPSYRSGAQINVNTQPANALESILTACQGRLSEIGGFYKIHLGAPDAPVMSFTDDDIVSDQQQVFRPFFALADSVNGIQATYPDPSQAWQTATAPAYYRTDLEVIDGHRRLMASPQFDMVPYPAQVQRLQKSAIEEAQRARTHALVLPPAFWLLEPGDVAAWTSVRNGYQNKLFRVDTVTDKANLDVGVALTEVDPSDYDWDQGTDFKPVIGGSTVIIYPPAQPVNDWSVEGIAQLDADHVQRRPAMQLEWDGTLSGIDALQYEVRLASDQSFVTSGATPPGSYGRGAMIVTQSLLPLTAYQARVQYVPSSPRLMLWTEWRNFSTPDARFTMADLAAGIVYQISTLQQQYRREIDELDARIADQMQSIAARLSLAKGTLNQQSWDQLQQVENLIQVATDGISASIDDVRTVALDTQNAFASYQLTTNAHFGALDASVTEHSEAIATLDGYVGARWGVDITVNGVITGAIRLDSGANWSAFTIQANKLQFQLPGVNGGNPVAALTVGTVNGVPAFGFVGNMYLDGGIFARMIAGQQIIAGHMAADSITATNGAIQNLSVQSLKIADNAIIVPIVQSIAAINPGGSSTTIYSGNLSIDTTGLSGKIMTLYLSCPMVVYESGNIATSCAFTAFVNGSTVNSYTFSGQNVSFTPTLSGSVQVIANGGVMTIPVAITMSNPGFWGVVSGSLFVMGAKR
ncbi:phage tail protein [Bradyrhizobium quebecense]|uniref:Phage tail protein n=1 Tax=Bradyrhizobium quebecense TaxID=2748629 RepID=A0A973WRV4_9BRAD|nr:phage tail protein [Bradyrhizobium quebecense]UGA45949.1 phage tail protein [Bradyrhizobium quebecense]